MQIVSETLLSYPCQHVVGEGQLCGMPCAAGFVRCSEHRQYSDKRALAHMLELAQDRVLRAVEEKIDEAVEQLVNVALHGPNQNAQMRAIETMLRLTGFVDLKIDVTGGAQIDPDERDKILMRLVSSLVKDEEKRSQLEVKILSLEQPIVDAEVVNDDDRPDD